jgi:hypothetical protein
MVRKTEKQEEKLLSAGYFGAIARALFFMQKLKIVNPNSLNTYLTQFVGETRIYGSLFV